MLHQNRLCQLLNIQYPILQGPFGGGLSSAKLVAAVSNAGGLGGYGAYQLSPEALPDLVKEIRSLTANPFNINLWVNDADENASKLSVSEYAKVAAVFKPYFDALNIPVPEQPENFSGRFERQAEVLLSLKPPVFSFVFGIPSKAILSECRQQKIITIGTATTLDEALALEEAGVDLVVASGFEAGGHRPSFHKPAEDSLHGTFALVRQVSAHLKKPIIAAGGIADAQGIKAALELGAAGVQIGTAFLACDESGASPTYKEILFSPRAKHTSLTRVFTGRLARGISGKIATEMDTRNPVLPFPLQTTFMASLRKAAMEQGKSELLTFWAGQNAGLLQHKTVNELIRALL